MTKIEYSIFLQVLGIFGIIIEILNLLPFPYPQIFVT